MNEADPDSTRVLERLQEWYQRECNGDWEHTYGITIETLDNPGWRVTIDLRDTVWEQLAVERKEVRRSDDDWIEFGIAEGRFTGGGGARNLSELLRTFLDIVKNG